MSSSVRSSSASRANPAAVRLALVRSSTVPGGTSGTGQHSWIVTGRLPVPPAATDRVRCGPQNGQDDPHY